MLNQDPNLRDLQRQRHAIDADIATLERRAALVHAAEVEVVWASITRSVQLEATLKMFLYSYLFNSPRASMEETRIAQEISVAIVQTVYAVNYPDAGKMPSAIWVEVAQRVKERRV